MAVTKESFNGAAPPEQDTGELELQLPPLPGELRRMVRAERVQRIQLKADRMEPRKTALLLAASALFGVFWLAGWACKSLFKAFAWTVAAAQVGWHDGMGLGPTKAEVAEENRMLRQEVQRLGGAPPDTPPAQHARLRRQVAR